MAMDTVIIGGGPAGALTALALGRAATIVDPAARLGPGSAYATREPRHLLNSRAGSMSVDPADPGDFATWARCRPDAFLPRGTYGAYLADRLGAVRHLARRAVRVRPAGSAWAVELSDGTTRPASAVVLALGPPPPVFPSAATVGVRRAPGYVPVPWSPGALDRVRPADRVLLLGTGLTAVDAVLTLLSRGHTGQIVAVSRHGLLPRAHTDLPTPAPVRAWESAPPGLRGLLREVRGSADWRATVDALRPRVDQVWAGLTLQEQQRFLRHLARYWEVHRHRCAPEVAATIAAAREARALVVAAGRVSEIRSVPPGFEVGLAGGRWTFDAVVNCTGPGHPAGLPLVRSLVADGLARADPLALGIDVDAAGRPVGRHSLPTEGLYVVGSLRRGRWWETTAIPEIRDQAYAIGGRLAAVPAHHAA
ncbi:putative NAD(P)/FAD-binding protein YdhS [Asanoa ferruginea]|uniref:Putative NAD(P)/FAD-binding protein YdhS n=2 Tax=Asanoa ferruginea TaxID=53367 RepID=A0A3E0A1E7_9ACTN|nr:putative NAD(P)/FAD-binding protein YdhS [Asanoa ferruginea]